MKREEPHATDSPRSVVIINLGDSIEQEHIRAMTLTLARLLVEQALVEHGVTPANDNQ